MRKTVGNRQPASESAWRQRYSERHKLERITQFPRGVRAPKRVRIYARREHFLLQWWEPREKRTFSERVDDDLIAAIFKAREIDDRLVNVKSSGRKQRMSHPLAIEGFLADLERRADAGEIDVATVKRYQSALVRHYAPFVDQSDIQRRYPYLADADRDFQRSFATFLQNRPIHPNGHANSKPRTMKSQQYVLDVVRALYLWAMDSERGALLPEGFVNPFADRIRKSQTVAFDPMRELDISHAMAIDLVQACDPFQLSLFAPLLLFGLRPGELGWLLAPNIRDGWLKVACVVELEYVTKGRRDKQFPIPTTVGQIWKPLEQRTGFLYRQRGIECGDGNPPLVQASLADLVESFEVRRRQAEDRSALGLRKVRDDLMKDAGQLQYQHVKLEFDKLAKELKWPKSATLKDLRHLFSTALESAGVPEFHRRYLMGQSFGNAPIVAYTHILKESLSEHFQRALDTTLGDISEAIAHKIKDLAA